MSFPSGPSNGQIAVLNGITYIYSLTNTSWTRLPTSNITVAGNVTASNLIATANVITSNLRVTGNATISGNLVANGYSNVFIAAGTLLNTSALTIAGNVNGRGGVGYLDALTLTSTYSAATNPNKWIRLNPIGGLEIINSAYTSAIMSLSDSGNLSVSGTYQVNGNQAVNGPAFSAVLLTGQVVASGSLANVVYNGEYYDTNNCYNTATGVFTPNVAGYYQFNWTAGANSYAASTGIVTSTLYKNNNELARGFRGVCNTGGVVAPGSASCYLNGTTDYVQIRFLQGSGSNATLEADAGAQAAGYSYANYFNGVMIRGA